MMDKSLILIGAASSGTLLLALGVVAGISSMNPKAEDTATGAPQQEVAQVSSPISNSQTESAPSSDQPIVAQPPTTVVRPPVQPITAADLNNLSAMVNLKNPKLAGGDKTQWKVALPMAEKLLSGPCDCEEKNWLNHFVQTGNYALSNAKEFEESAKITASLPKNDEDTISHH